MTPTTPPRGRRRNVNRLLLKAAHLVRDEDEAFRIENLLTPTVTAA